MPAESVQADRPNPPVAARTFAVRSTPIAKGRTADPKHFQQCRFGGQPLPYLEHPDGDGLGNSVDNRIGPLDLRQGPRYVRLE